MGMGRGHGLGRIRCCTGASALADDSEGAARTAFSAATGRAEAHAAADCIYLAVFRASRGGGACAVLATAEWSEWSEWLARVRVGVRVGVREPVRWIVRREVDSGSEDSAE